MRIRKAVWVAQELFISSSLLCLEVKDPDLQFSTPRNIITEQLKKICSGI